MTASAIFHQLRPPFGGGVGATHGVLLSVGGGAEGGEAEAGGGMPELGVESAELAPEVPAAPAVAAGPKSNAQFPQKRCPDLGVPHWGQVSVATIYLPTDDPRGTGYAPSSLRSSPSTVLVDAESTCQSAASSWTGRKYRLADGTPDYRSEVHSRGPLTGDLQIPRVRASRCLSSRSVDGTPARGKRASQAGLTGVQVFSRHRIANA
jgi:hypothetical protein